MTTIQIDRFTNRPTTVPPLALAPGWQARPLTPPSTLLGAAGVRVGPDGRLYVAEAFGNRISAIDLSTRSVSTICEVGNPIVAPDDIAFDTRGIMYVPDVMSARVCARMPNGEIHVVASGTPCANGITVYQDRVFMDECRPAGRLAEIFPDGSAPKILAENLPAPNALAVGPDGYLYFPLVTESEIWRVPVGGGPVQRFVGDLGVPTAVKFNAKGELYSVQARTGELLKFDVTTGSRTIVSRMRPGLDNLDLTPDGRIFVSHYIDGGVEEILPDGTEVPLVAPGMLGPYGLAITASGTLYLCDGLSLIAVNRDVPARRVGHRMDGHFPGWVRGITEADNGFVIVTTAEGALARYHPESHETELLDSGLQEAMDVAITADGEVMFTETGTGSLVALAPGKPGKKRVVSSSLARPMGLALGRDGTAYVAEAKAGRVVAVDSSGITPIVEDLAEPHGLAIYGDTLFALDVGTRQLIACDLLARTTTVIATGLPIGSPPGTVAQILPGIPQRIPGPLSAFAGLAAGPDGTLYVSANGSGMAIAIEPPAI
jgi:sugar lactone lactonase YvrE